MEQTSLQSDQLIKVELYISCRNLLDKDVFSKSDPFVKVFMKNQISKQWSAVLQTETIKDNLNPNFKTPFLVDYIFEIQQPVKFEVRDNDGSTSELLGICETSIGAIVGSKNSMFVSDLIEPKQRKSKGKIIIRCEKVKECSDQIMMKWVGKKLMNTDGWFDKSDPFLRFFRLRQDNSGILVKETEVVMDCLNPVWKAFEIKAQTLCNGDYARQIKVECWDWEKSQKFQYIGDCQFTINDLKNGRKEFELHNAKKKKKTGTLVLEQFVIQERPSFLDYIRGGVQLNMILAIDYTGSNGVPSQPISLHYINRQNPQALNQYQQAIYGIGQILINYDYDKMIPCYGFGGKPHFPSLNFNQVMHCFPVNGNPQNPNANGLQQIFEYYNYSLQCIELSGPTLFQPIIMESIKSAQESKQQGSSVYSVLLILTDGEIHDMQPTIDAISQATHIPLSIIIIGVGNADFTKMNILDGDQGLFNSQGQKVARDLVQFVPFNQFAGQPEILAQNVLQELPDQLAEYYRLMGIKPNKPVEMSLSSYQVDPNASSNQLNAPTQLQAQQLNPAQQMLPGNAQPNPNFAGGQGMQVSSYQPAPLQQQQQLQVQANLNPQSQQQNFQGMQFQMMNSAYANPQQQQQQQYAPGQQMLFSQQVPLSQQQPNQNQYPHLK